MKRTYFLWPVAVTLLVPIGCGPSRQPTPPTPAALGVSDVGGGGGDDAGRVQALWAERAANGARTEPCLGPGDLLEISVFRWADLQNFRTRITPAGTIALPLIGSMRAAGLTESQLRDNIADALKRGYMRDPQVSVFVAEYVSQQVSVTGAVSRPGLFGLSREHRTVSDMISEAGGYTEHAGGRILLYPAKGNTCDGTPQRPNPNGTAGVEPVEIDTAEQYAANQNPLTLPVVGGDSIVVNRGRFLVNGWVTTPGAYDIAPGMTALGGVGAAGGALYPADMASVIVWRAQRGGTKKKIEVNMNDVTSGSGKDVTLQAGDVVEVPASSAKMVPYGAYWLLTTVIRVGASIPIF